MPFPTLLSVNDWRKKGQPDPRVEELLTKIYDAKTIYERFDNLIDLLTHVQSFSENKNYSDLHSSILTVIGHIVNEDTIENIHEKIEARVRLRQYDPYYMPWARPEPGDVSNDPWALYKAESRNKDKEELESIFVQFYDKLRKSSNLLVYGGRGSKEEETIWTLRSNVDEKTFSPEELEGFRAIPYQGKLLKLATTGKADNRRLTFDYVTTAKLSIKGYDTFSQTTEDFPKRAIYTVHANGSFFIGRSLAPQRISWLLDPDPILHPSYADYYSQTRLFMAGQTEIPQGEPTMMDSGSGHYAPDYEQTQQAITFFKKLGLVNNHTLLPYYRFDARHNEYVYTPIHCTQLQAILMDFANSNRIDIRKLTPEYLKEQNPELYMLYIMQSKINDELATWKKESSVIIDFPSPQTTQLNQAVELFSKFGDFTQPDKTLALLQNVAKAIDNWNEYHQTSGKTSRRQGAVNNLEKRVQEQILYYTSYLLLTQFTGEIPGNYHEIVKDFVDRKADIALTIERIAKLRDVSSSGFFEEKKKVLSETQDIKQILHLIAQSQDASPRRLKEINSRLTQELEGIGVEVSENLSLH
ncbi:Uncharacterised protein [Legionella lansingensis]|uniref:Uncharacterized protein n=1 Tax=Legionella lansingensis TaxID=45067 RepID=A0A0W0VVK4_9GAMM|nr:hypothetical protein [Legionella lansingensis]KTD24295.1 hypothetical protein Llan_0434 [Legionella lansingensis]SNV51872.1 Uncharacterised protein [Legionella lansingensis]